MSRHSALESSFTSGRGSSFRMILSFSLPCASFTLGTRSRRFTCRMSFSFSFGSARVRIVSSRFTNLFRGPPCASLQFFGFLWSQNLFASLLALDRLAFQSLKDLARHRFHVFHVRGIKLFKVHGVKLFTACALSLCALPC